MEFQTEIAILRNRIHAEDNLEAGRFIRAKHSNFLPLIILFQEYFEKFHLDKDQARQLRLDMVSYWIQQPIGSFYDLTAYQCSTILNFLRKDLQARPSGEGADEFLDCTQEELEGPTNSVSLSSLFDEIELPTF